MADVELLAGLPLFQGMHRNHIEQIARIAVAQSHGRGDMVFHEGDDGNGLYIMISGRVKIFKLSQEGKEQILHIFGPGEPFGEVAVFAGRHFPANAETIEESKVLFIPRNSFVELIEREPSLALNMLAVLSLRLRLFARLIEDLSLKEVPGRLAAYLLFLSERDEESEELKLDIAKSQLASVLGTIPETLSRILARMSGQGIIEVEGRRIRLLDRSALEELAEGGKLH